MKCSKSAQSRKNPLRGRYEVLKERAIIKKAVAWSLWSVQSARNHEKSSGGVTMKCSKSEQSRKNPLRGRYEVFKERAITKKAVAWSLWSVQSARNHEKSRGGVTMKCSKSAQSRKKLWRGHYEVLKERAITEKSVTRSL